MLANTTVLWAVADAGGPWQISVGVDDCYWQLSDIGLLTLLKARYGEK